MAQPMLKPGEVRKAPAVDEGFTVEVSYVAGGSFTQVVLRDPQGNRVFSRNHQFDTDALKQFEELAGITDDAMEA